MKSRSETIVVATPHRELFTFLADIENLPAWATEFARELRRVGDRYKVVNGLGEFYFDIRADEESGVIDMYAGPTDDQMAVFPTRVVGLPGGRSAFTFTMFQTPGMSDELFEQQHASLLRELDGVRRRFGG